jgi:hypothetical protein
VSVDASVLRITDHACRRYCTRILGIVPYVFDRARARREIADALRSAEPVSLPATHGGMSQEGYALDRCVVLAKCGAITTVITREQYEQGRASM